MPSAHHVSRAADERFGTPAAYAPHSRGYRRWVRLGHDVALHASIEIAGLAPGGRVEHHLHSFEELVFVLAGSPRLELGGIAVELGRFDAVAIGAGETHAWSNPDGEEARWIELRTPPTRPDGAPPDTVFAPRGPGTQGARPVDPGDPRLVPCGRWAPPGAAPSSPPAAGMAAPTLSIPGVTGQMVIDARHGAVAARTFVIEFEAGARLGLHDHPFEETFSVLEGEIVFIADGREHLLEAGDVAFAGVGCLHAFENRSGAPCRWLESQSPQPPAKGDTRVQAVWDRLAQNIPLS